MFKLISVFILDNCVVASLTVFMLCCKGNFFFAFSTIPCISTPCFSNDCIVKDKSGVKTITAKFKCKNVSRVRAGAYEAAEIKLYDNCQSHCQERNASAAYRIFASSSGHPKAYSISYTRILHGFTRRHGLSNLITVRPLDASNCLCSTVACYTRERLYFSILEIVPFLANPVTCSYPEQAVQIDEVAHIDTRY